MIDVQLIRQGEIVYSGSALNEAAIRSKVPHTIMIRLYINDRFYASYLGDGVVCATPTGSTAYSFSAGGPIIDASLQALVVTPICPQLSSTRSLVVSTKAKIALDLDSDYDAGLAVDGEEEILMMRSDRISINCSAMTANLIQLTAISSADKVLHKLDRLNLLKKQR